MINWWKLNYQIINTHQSLKVLIFAQISFSFSWWRFLVRFIKNRFMWLTEQKICLFWLFWKIRKNRFWSGFFRKLVWGMTKNRFWRLIEESWTWWKGRKLVKNRFTFWLVHSLTLFEQIRRWFINLLICILILYSFRLFYFFLFY